MKCGYQACVGEVGELCNVFAEDEFGEERGGGGADGASVTFEARFVYDRFVELQFDPDAIAAERIELFVADIRHVQAAVVARVTEVVQKRVTIKCRHAITPSGLI